MTTKRDDERFRPRGTRRSPRGLARDLDRLEARVLPAVITPFTPRYSANANGDILFVANTLMTAPSSDSGAAAGRAGTGTKLNNNDFAMTYVDVDGVASTFNSSQAGLTLPAGGTVLFAGLYWGANSGSSARGSVLLRTPGAAAYTTVAGTVLGADSTNNYQGFADVTALVRSAGAGDYTVANVQANTGGDRHAGWALVVVYGDPAAPPRNLTVFDGLAVVNTSSTSATISISGFTAPPTGSVNASVGVVGYEGDLGFTGDVIRLNGAVLSDSLNPANNFFNSSITNRGARVASKNPDYVNQLGFDADIVSTTGVIPNGATSASISLATTNETYLPGVVTTAIDLYAPVVSVGKSFVDLNGGNVEPGDVLEFTDVVSVTSGEAAAGFVLLNPIPTNTTLVPGSLQIVSGANAGAKTDVAGDDQAELDVANGRIVFRLGAGASSTAGGTAAVGTTSVVRYRVRVGDAAPNGATIAGQSTATFTGLNTGASLSAASSLATATVLRRADLAVAQSVDRPAPNVGEFVVLTTTLTNSGPFDASGVVNAGLPAGLQFDSATVSQGTYDAATGTWSAGSLAPGGQATLSVRARVVTPAAFATVASITASSLPDPTSANNSASVILTPQLADLALAKSVDAPRPNVGAQVTFTTTLANRGPNAASGIRISDALPAGFVLVTSSASQGSYDPGSGVWSAGALASGASATLTLVAEVGSPSAAVATASILSADQFDPIAGNNAASSLVTPLQADVAVATGVDDAQPNVGDVITYTVTVTNSGPDAATGVVLASSGIPAAVQILSVTPGQGTFDPATTRWTVGSLAPGATTTLVARARVLASDITPLTISVVARDQYDPNPANDSSRTPVDPQEASLSTSIFASQPRPDRGELVTLTAVVRNVGPSGATGVVVSLPLPAGLQFVSAGPGQGAYDPASGNWSLGSLGASSTATLSVVARVASPSPTSVTATILAADQFDPSAVDDSSTVAITPTQSDLFLTLTGNDPTPNVGDVTTLTFTLSNQGPDAATGVVAAGSLPAGVTLLSYTASAGTFDPATGVWTVGTVETQTPRSLVLQVRLDSPDPLVGSASIIAADQYDPDPSNNGLTVTAIPRRADLAVAQGVDDPTPDVGDVVTFAVVVSNAGPDDATGVRIEHRLPAGLAYVSASPGQGAYDPASGVWSVGSLGAGASQTLYVRARVTSPSAAAATARVVAAGQYDPDPTNGSAVAAVAPRRSDLALSAVASNTSPQVGELVTFTFTVAASGPDSAEGVAVRSLLAAGLVFESAAASRGSYDPTSGVWSVGTVAPGDPAAIAITARVVSTSAFVAAGTIVASDQYDPDPGNNAASVFGTPQVVDVAVTKTVDSTRPNVGDVIVLTTTVTNAGPSTATGLLVRSFAGAGLTVLSSSPTQGVYDPITGIWDLGALPGSGVQVLSIVARVDSPNAAQSTASVAAIDQYDSVPGNASASVAIAPQRSDVALSQTVDVASPNVGQYVTFTVTASSLGPDAATGVRVLQSLPPGFQFVSSTASAGGFDPATGVWTVGSIAPGTPQSLRVVARVAAVGGASASASVLASDQYDPNPANNTASTAASPQSADVALSSSFDATRPNVGDIVTYNVSVRNSGPSGATGLSISAPLPAGLTFLTATPSGGTYDPATGLWAAGGLGAGAVETLLITARVDAPAMATASAAVVAVDQFDPSPGDDATTASLTPQRADLAIVATSSRARPDVGEEVVLSVSLANAGPDAAGGVSAAIPLPAGLTFVGASGAGVYDPSTGLWTVGAVASGTPAVLQIRVRVDSPDALAVPAAIVASDQFDPVPANDASTAALTPLRSDLAVVVAVDRPTPNVGDLVTFSVVVSNAGPDDAAGVRVSGALPAGLAFDSASPSQGVYSASTGRWELGDVAAGGSAVLTIRARVASPATSTYAASVAAATRFDPATGDNASSASVTPQAAGLSLAAVVDAPTPNVGDVVTLTLTLANAGPDAAAGVHVASRVPAGFTLVGATPSLGSFDLITGDWFLPNVPGGASPMLTLALAVGSPSAAVYSAAIVAADQYDPDRGDDSASVAIAPQRSDLALSATVSDPRPNVGDQVSFTFTLEDLGPSPATGVAVAVPIPAGYSFVSASASQGAYDPATGLWSPGASSPGAAASLTLTLTIDSPSPPTLAASIASADQYDPSPANNATGAAVQPQRSDLGLSVTVSDPAPNVGSSLTYTIRLTNAGPDDATNIVLRDVLPAGVSFVEAGPGAQAYDQATGLWAVGDLAAGGELVLTLTVTVDDPDPAVNRVEVASVDQYDPSPANNAAETSTSPQQVELRLTGTLDQPRPNVGGVVTFTLTLANFGFDDATGIVVDAPLPAGLTPVSATPGLGVYDPATGAWTIPALAVGGSATLTISAVVTAPGERDLATRVRQVDQFDPNLANNAASVRLDPQQADLDLSTSVDSPRPNVGDAVVLTVTVANRGPDAATGAVVSSPLPAGLTFLSADAGQGAYDPVTGAWTLGGVAPGATATLRITARVDAASPLLGTAAVVASDQYDPDRAGDAASASIVPRSSDLSLSSTIDVAAPRVGAVVTFTVTLANQGPDPSTGVLVANALPAGLALVSASPSRGAYDAAAGLWSVGDLGLGEVGVLTVRALVVAPDAGAATAAIVARDVFDPDASDDATSSAYTPGRSNLITGLAASTTTPNAGEVVTLTVSLANAGPDAAGGTILLGELPPGLVFVDASASQGVYSPASRTWALGEVASGAVPTLEIRVRAAAPGPQIASVQVLATDQFDPNPSDDLASIVITPRAAALAVASNVDVARPNVGDLVTFTVSLSNAGPDAATGVVLAAPLPAGLQFVRAASGVGEYNPASGVWGVGAVAPGATQTLQIVARVVSPSPGVVTSSVARLDQFDATAADDSASSAIDPQRAFLTLNASVDDPTPDAGGEVVYTFILANDGPDAATGVRASHLLPPGLQFLAATASTGAYDPATGMWGVGALAPGSSATLRVRARAVSGLPSLATAVVAADQFGASDGVQASVAVLPRRSDVGVSIVADDPTPDVGDVVTLTVTVGGQGPDAASGVAVGVDLPPGLAFISAAPGVGSFDPASGRWDVGTLPSASAGVLVIRARVVSPVASTVAVRVAAADPFDIDPTDDRASVTLTPRAADLSVGFEGVPAAATVGRVVSIRVVAANGGPSDATAAGLPVRIPAGFRLVSSSPDRGSFDPASGQWSLGTLPAGGSATLSLTLEAVAVGDASFAAGPIRGAQADLDPSRDAAAATVLVRPPAPIAAVDLGLRFDGEPGPVRLGATTVVRLVLGNPGAFDATGVVVPVAIPAGFRLADSAADLGRYDPIARAWTLDRLPPGGSAALTLTLEAVAVGGARVAAGPARADQRELDPSDNATAVALSVRPGAGEPPTDSGVIQGSVFEDLDGDGMLDPGEASIAGATIVLRGIDARGLAVSLTTTTGPDGSYRFEALPPGTYTLTASHPTIPLAAASGSLGGVASGGRIGGIVLLDGGVGSGYSFFRDARTPAAAGSIGGRVYLDLDRDGRFGPGDLGVSSVRIILRGVGVDGRRVVIEAVTAADGSYTFPGLPAGDYSLRHVRPGFLRPFRTHPGTAGGSPRGDHIDHLTLGEGEAAAGYDFGTLPGPGCRLAPLAGPGGAGRRARPVPDGPLIHRFIPSLGRPSSGPIDRRLGAVPSAPSDRISNLRDAAAPIATRPPFAAAAALRNRAIAERSLPGAGTSLAPRP